MLSELLKKKSLFHNLYTIDKNIADKYREKPCPYCGGPLHFANYLRKPRGEPDGLLSEEYFLRFSLCCGKEGCRHRVMPPSCRFLGKKVYWHPAILSIVTDIQSKESCSIPKLADLLTISRNSITRWLDFYANIFPSSSQWKIIRGLVITSVKNNELPAGLVNHFLSIKSSAQEALVSCLKFLIKGTAICQKIRAG